MPEFAPGNKARSEALRKKVLDRLNPFAESGEPDRPMSEEARRIADAIGGEVMGSGAERVVIKRPDGKVLGIYRYPLRDGANKLKQQFYTSRILNTLFPQFYPHVYAAGFSSSVPDELKALTPLVQKLFPEYVLSYTITEMIDKYEDAYSVTRKDEQGNEIVEEVSLEEGKRTIKDRAHSGISLKEKIRSGPDKEGEHPAGTYMETRMILDKLDINLFTDDDPGKNNIGAVYTDGTSFLDGLDPNGVGLTRSEGERKSYSDRIHELYSGSGRSKVPLSSANREKLLDWMKEEKYSDDAIRTVESSFNRLLELKDGT